MEFRYQARQIVQMLTTLILTFHLCLILCQNSQKLDHRYWGLLAIHQVIQPKNRQLVSLTLFLAVPQNQEFDYSQLDLQNFQNHPHIRFEPLI